MWVNHHQVFCVLKWCDFWPPDFLTFKKDHEPGKAQNKTIIIMICGFLTAQNSGDCVRFLVCSGQDFQLDAYWFLPFPIQPGYF